MRIVIQINGKLKDQFDCAISASQEEVSAMALAREDVQKHIAGKELKKKSMYQRS